MIEKVWNYLRDHLTRSWRQWTRYITSTTALYRQRKIFLFLDASLCCLLFGVLLYMFLVIPSLDGDGLKYSGVVIITLLITSAFIYSELKKYLLSKSQRKLNQWISKRHLIKSKFLFLKTSENF
jgi:hypothetical protein